MRQSRGGRRLRRRHRAAAAEWKGEGENGQRSREEGIRRQEPGNFISSQVKISAPAKVDNPMLGELLNELVDLLALLEKKTTSV